jgi:hypothetical protein
VPEVASISHKSSLGAPHADAVESPCHQVIAVDAKEHSARVAEPRSCFLIGIHLQEQNPLPDFLDCLKLLLGKMASSLPEFLFSMIEKFGALFGRVERGKRGG